MIGYILKKFFADITSKYLSYVLDFWLEFRWNRVFLCLLEYGKYDISNLKSRVKYASVAPRDRELYSTLDSKFSDIARTII